MTQESMLNDRKVVLNEQLFALEARMLEDPDATRPQLLHLLAQAQDSRDSYAEAYALCLLGGCAFFQGNYPDTTLYAKFALNVSDRFDHLSLKARALNALGLALTRTGQYDEGMQYFLDSLTLADSLNDDASKARAITNLAGAHLDLGDFDRAMELAAEGAEVARRAGIMPPWAVAEGVSISALWHAGRLGEARERIPALLRVAGEHGLTRVQCDGLLYQALLHVQDLEYLRAIAVAEDMVRVAEGAQDEETLGSALWLLGDCYLTVGRHDDALRALTRSAAINDVRGHAMTTSRLARSFATLYEQTGQTALALKALKDHMHSEHRLHDGAMLRRSQLIDMKVKLELARQRVALSSPGAPVTAAHSLQELTYRSTHDALSHALNRSAFWQQAGQVLENLPLRQSAGVLLLDLCGLAEVNVTHGYAAGDLLITETVRRIKRVVGRDDLVGRTDGDEFIVLLRDLSSAEELKDVTEELHAVLSRPVTYEDWTLSPRVSMGAAIAPLDGRDLTTIHRNVELALQECKARGAAAPYLYHPTMNIREKARRTIKHDLPGALRTGQLNLAYQAQYRLPGRTLTGFEALLRWTHPTDGKISPAEFIPLAEESGIIIDIGRWAMRLACQQAKAWAFDTHGLRMAVNVSPLQFMQSDFVSEVREILEETGLPGCCLTLELTEGVFHSDVTRAVMNIRRLMELGVQVAMDDFGTGYSSLSLLKTLPIEQLKIDRAFLADLTREHPNFAVSRQFMQVMVQFAQTLGLTVVAEGVETLEHLEILNELGCHEAQGYLLSEPVAVELASVILWEAITPPAPSRAS